MDMMEISCEEVRVRDDRLNNRPRAATSDASGRPEARAAALVDFFSLLPPELALYLVSFLDHYNLCALARVCHLCHTLAYDDENWKRLYTRTWARHSASRADLQLPICGACTTWRALFRERLEIEWEYCAVDLDAVDEVEEEQEQEQEQEQEEEQEEAAEASEAGTNADAPSGEAKPKKPPPPKPVEVPGRGKYHTKKLRLPATVRDWLTRGHALQKEVEAMRQSRAEEKRNCTERTPEYLKRKREHHEMVTRLLVIACEEYASAMSMPQSKDATDSTEVYVATNNWGISLTELARMKHGAVSDRLFLRAYGKLAQSAELRRGMDDHWWALSEWAATLRTHAARKMTEASTEVASAAGTDYATVDCLFEQSCRKLAEAHALSPTDSQILSEWADALSEYATSKIAALAKTRIVLSPEQVQHVSLLFRESYGKYEASLQLSDRDLDKDIVLSNYGLALSDHAMIASPAETKELFQLSYEKYNQASTLKPDNALTQCNLAMTFVLDSCSKTDAEERERLWNRAEEILKAQLRTNYYWTYFCMARLSSVRGREDECREWLQRCARKNYLAKRTKWFCVHFANVKDLPWFQAMEAVQLAERQREKQFLNGGMSPSSGDKTTTC